MFCWDEAKTSSSAAEEDPAQMKEAVLMEMYTESHSPQALALPWHRETVMEIIVMDSVVKGNLKGNLKATEAMDQADMGTEMERGAKDPAAPVKVHSGSHCCISGQEQELCDHLGYPESRADRLVFPTQTPPPAPGSDLQRSVAIVEQVCSEASGASSE